MDVLNVRNMLSIEEVKLNIITSDIKLVSYSSIKQLCLILGVSVKTGTKN